MNEREEFLPDEICHTQLGLMPETTLPCHVVCDASTCTFSDWGAWGACSKRCGGHRKRVRMMEGMTDRIADCYDSAKYPLSETLACHCPGYSAEPTERWSHCIVNTDTASDLEPETLSLIGGLATGSAYCGIGKRYQAKVCKSPDGQVASASVCGASGKGGDGIMLSLLIFTIHCLTYYITRYINVIIQFLVLVFFEDFVEEMCFTPCPRDCQISAWSEWGRCKLTSDSRCGLGTQTRFRYLVESNLDGGRKCPPLTEDQVGLLFCFLKTAL